MRLCDRVTAWPVLLAQPLHGVWRYDAHQLRHDRRIVEVGQVRRIERGETPRPRAARDGLHCRGQAVDHLSTQRRARSSRQRAGRSRARRANHHRSGGRHGRSGWRQWSRGATRCCCCRRGDDRLDSGGTSFPVESSSVSHTAPHPPMPRGLTVGRTVTVHGACACALAGASNDPVATAAQNVSTEIHATSTRLTGTLNARRLRSRSARTRFVTTRTCRVRCDARADPRTALPTPHHCTHAT
jgi:hypothetical protein